MKTNFYWYPSFGIWEHFLLYGLNVITDLQSFFLGYMWEMIWLLEITWEAKKKNLIFIFDIVCSVGVHKVSELEEFQKRMESSQLKTFNLTKSDLVKDHLRYLVNILWMNFNFFLVIWFLYFILYIWPWKLSYIDWSSVQGEPGFISCNCIIKKETLCMGSYGVKNIDAVMKTSYIDQKKCFFYWSLIKCCIRW